MKLEKRPNLLIQQKLLSPIKKARDGINEIKSHSSVTDEEVILQGLFVLAVSRFETMIVDTLKYLLLSIPQKIEKTALQLSKEELLSHQFELIEIQVDKLLHDLAYKPLKEELKYFSKMLSIEIAETKDIESLHEIKATRNLLLHNELITNSIYLEMAGAAKRKTGTKEKLKVDKSYLASSLKTLVAVIDDLENKISKEYEEYTINLAIKY